MFSAQDVDVSSVQVGLLDLIDVLRKLALMGRPENPENGCRLFPLFLYIWPRTLMLKVTWFLLFFHLQLSGLSFRKDLYVLLQLCHGRLGPSNPELHMSVVVNAVEVGKLGGKL